MIRCSIRKAPSPSSIGTLKANKIGRQVKWLAYYLAKVHNLHAETAEFRIVLTFCWWCTTKAKFPNLAFQTLSQLYGSSLRCLLNLNLRCGQPESASST